mmetsp:Transcript_59690/g.151378  ORF Transcript_59690/g.151378 Transcript_59690/m.151378 type:complete len:258 (+) Transcript_59690:2038-2811(+)
MVPLSPLRHSFKTGSPTSSKTSCCVACPPKAPSKAKVLAAPSIASTAASAAWPCKTRSTASHSFLTRTEPAVSSMSTHGAKMASRGFNGRVRAKTWTRLQLLPLLPPPSQPLEVTPLVTGAASAAAVAVAVVAAAVAEAAVGDGDGAARAGASAEAEEEGRDEEEAAGRTKRTCRTLSGPILAAANRWSARSSSWPPAKICSFAPAASGPKAVWTLAARSRTVSDLLSPSTLWMDVVPFNMPRACTANIAAAGSSPT